MDWDRVAEASGPEPAVDTDELLTRTQERVKQLQQGRTRRRMAVIGSVAGLGVVMLAVGIINHEPGESIATTAGDDVAATTTSQEPIPITCDLPPSAGDLGLDVTVDLARNQDGSVGGSATIHNVGNGIARITLDLGGVELYPVDDAGRPTAKTGLVIASALTIDIAEGDSIVEPVHVVSEPCPGRGPTTGYAAVVVGLRDETIAFMVSSRAYPSP